MTVDFVNTRVINSQTEQVIEIFNDGNALLRTFGGRPACCPSLSDGGLALLASSMICWKGTLVQYAGCLHRLYAGKKGVRVCDYVDQNVPMLMRMYEKRLRGYRSMGYSLVSYD